MENSKKEFLFSKSIGKYYYLILMYFLLTMYIKFVMLSNVVFPWPLLLDSGGCNCIMVKVLCKPRFHFPRFENSCFNKLENFQPLSVSQVFRTFLVLTWLTNLTKSGQVLPILDKFWQVLLILSKLVAIWPILEKFW